jgi:uncharacterized protein YhbP (UPF0306 family)
MEQELNTIAAFLREQSTLALATIDERGQPSVAPLYYIVDEELTLFWLSTKTSLHSENLKRAPSAAATIYLQTENWQEIRGVQLRGTVALIADRERRGALIETYRLRFQLGTIFKAAIARCNLYALRPKFVRFIDNSGVFGHKFEIELEEKNRQCEIGMF